MACDQNESKKISAQSYFKQGIQSKDIRLAMDDKKLAVIHHLQARYSKDTQ
ncbi:hypothetical protein [Thalassotalea sp. PP2-459]|uniref:hypothetical protein n=1 Tax=Thalassotalea sp. PP2-459 TaxID=1742724 RepID=UPI00158827C5|nr:hypothetical protein [Thalassotalea sp. PP2-459]